MLINLFLASDCWCEFKWLLPNTFRRVGRPWLTFFECFLRRLNFRSICTNGYRAEKSKVLSLFVLKVNLLFFLGWNMSGIGLIFLLLAIVAALCGLYFVAWCMFGVQRNHKEGHYILESEDERHDDDYGKGNLYTGLGKFDLYPFALISTPSGYVGCPLVSTILPKPHFDWFFWKTPFLFNQIKIINLICQLNF